jgi:hypothetical protein
METLENITGGFETWWIVAIFTMWFFSAYAIHTGIKTSKSKVFFYLVLAFSIVGFIRFYTFG